MTAKRGEVLNQRTEGMTSTTQSLMAEMRDVLRLAKEISEPGEDEERNRTLRKLLDQRFSGINQRFSGINRALASLPETENELVESNPANLRDSHSNEQTRSLDRRLFAEAFRTTPIGVAVESLEGQPIFVNPALCSMLGFSEQEMKRKHCVEFSPPEDAAKDWALFQQLLSGSIERYQIEKRYFRRDRSVLWGRLSVSLVNDRSSPMVLALVEDITEKRTQQEAVSDLSRKLIIAQEQERARIARELHDDITQRLALLAIEIDQITENCDQKRSTLRNLAQDIARKTREIASDIQALSHELDSSKLGYLGLATAAKSWCRDFGGRTGIEIRFESTALPKSIEPEISLCVFRVLQEALQNASKHSGTKQVHVQLREKSGEIQLSVRDSGIGFEMGAVTQGRGLGLTSMRERVRMVGGTIVIDSMPLAGTAIIVRVPLTTARPSGEVAV